MPNRLWPLALLVIPQLASAYAVKDIFRELKQRTFQTSPDKFITESVSEEKTLRFQQSWTRFLPQVDLNLENRQIKDYSLINSGALGDAPQLQGLLKPQDANLYVWSLNLYLPLYKKDFFTSYSLGKTEKELALHNLSEFDQTHLIRLQQKFSELMVAQFKILAARNAIKKAEKNLEEVKISKKLGQRIESDVYRNEGKLLSLRFKKSQADQERLKCLHDLQEITGLAYEDLLLITQINRVADENELMDAITVFADAKDSLKGVKRFSPARFQFDKSPLYKKLSLELEVEKTQTNTLTDREHPEVYLQGSLYNQGGNLVDTIESGRKSHVIAVVLKVPLFNSGRTILAGKEQYLASKRLERQKEQKIQNLLHDFSQKSLELQSRELLVKSLESSLKEAQKKLRATERSHEFGQNSRVDVMESIDNLLSRQVELAQERSLLFNESQRFLWETGML